MVRQYPYSLWVKTFSGEAIKNDSGDYTATLTVWEQVCTCRDEANSGGQMITLEDATTYAFDALIQLPVYCPEQAVGTEIQVRDGNAVRLSATVKRFRKDQLHCRLWV